MSRNCSSTDCSLDDTGIRNARSRRWVRRRRLVLTRKNISMMARRIEARIRWRFRRHRSTVRRGRRRNARRIRLPRRKFGIFTCRRCHRQWYSRFADPDKYQMCLMCGRKKYPGVRLLEWADRRNRYGGHMARFCQACCEKGYLCSLDRYRRCPSDDLSDSGFLEDYSSPCEAERGFYRHRSPVTEHASGEMEPLDVIRNKRRREWSSVDSDDEFDRRENARCSSNASDHDDNRSDGLIHLARMDLRRLLDYRRRNTRTERQPLACRRYRPY